MEITYDTHTTGYAAFTGERKVAIITTRHHLGLYRNGLIIYEPMLRSSWTIHFTSPQMSVELCEAIIRSLPTEA